MAMTVEQIRRLTVRGDTQGLDKMKADLAGVDAAQRQVAASSAAVNSSTRQTSGSVISAAKEYERLSRSIDPAARAQAAFDRGLRVSNAALAQGAISIEQQQRTMGLLRQRLDEARNAGVQHAGSVNLQRGAMQQLSFQVNDMATMLASGSSPFQVLATQGGQVFQVLQMGPNGVGGSLKGIGSALMGLITPTRLAVAGIAAVGAAGALAWNAWDNRIRGVQQALNGLGATTGQSSSNIMQAASRAAASGPISYGNALIGATQFASAGVFPSVTPGAITASRQFSGATGDSLSDVQKMLAGALSDPSRGFAEISKRVGDLGIETQRQIERLQNQGRLEEAQQTLLRAFNNRLAETTDTTGILSGAMEKAGGLWSTFWTNLGKIGATQSPREAIEAANRGEARAAALGMTGLVEINRRDRIEAEKRLAKEDADTQRRLMEANRIREQRIAEERDKITSLSQVSAANVTARTASERLAIEQERLRREAIYDTSRANTLATETERARTMAIAEANKALRDYQRNSADESFMGGARNEREQFIRRMQLETRELRERTDVLGRPPDSEWRSQIKYSEQAGNTYTGPVMPPRHWGPLPPADLSESISLKKLVETFGQVARTLDPSAVAGSPRQITVSQRNQLPVDNNRPGPVDNSRLADWDRNKFDQFVYDVDMAREASKRSLQAQIETFGMSTAQIAARNEQIRLENDVIRIGLPLLPERRAEIEKLAAAEGELAAARERAQEQQQKFIQSLDFVRSSTNDLLSGPLKALARGEKPGEAFRQAGQRVGERMIDMGVGSITEMLWGKNGKADSGILGKLLGIGGQNTANMQVTAGSVMIVGGVPGISGSLGGGGLLGGLFGKLFGGGGEGGWDYGGSMSELNSWSANGNAFSRGNVVPFARGGAFVRGATYFPMAHGKTGVMGEAGPEAVMPLGRDRSGKLGVVVAGRERQSAQERRMSMAYRGGDLIVQGNVNEDTLPKLRAMLAESEKRTERNLRRNFGGYQQHAQEHYST